MSDNSKIEWTDATWSPVTGCTRISEGCTHCYIERTPPFRMAGRVFRHREHHPDCRTVTASNWARMQETIECTCPSSSEIGATTGVVLHPDRLGQPLRWRKPRRIFVCSMADMFHTDVPDEYIAKVWQVMAETPEHTYQVLTKRPGRMRSLLSAAWFREKIATSCLLRGDEWPLRNVWLGVSAENQHWADIRIPSLLQTPAAVRWVSAEPLLGPIDMSEATGWLLPGPDCPCERGEPFCHPTLDWVVTGGESGPGARPVHPQWIRHIRDQCRAAGAAYHHKQWGEWAELYDGAEVWGSDMAVGMDGSHARVDQSGYPSALPGAAVMRRVGKKAAGRVLDGRTWDEYPK